MTDSISLRQRPIPERVQEYLRQFILDNELQAGDPLPTEAELARRFEVSRGAVREGVKALVSTGLIDVRRGNGLFVQPFSFAPLLTNLRFGLRTDKRAVTELLQIREVLELGLIDSVIAQQTPPSIARVRDSLELMRRAAANGESLRPADRLFHRSLFAIAGNTLALDFADIFWEALNAMSEWIDRQPADPEETCRAHELVLDAVERRDGDAARRLLKAHYADIETRLGTA